MNAAGGITQSNSATGEDRRYLPLVGVLFAAAAGITLDRSLCDAYVLSSFPAWWVAGAVALASWWLLWRKCRNPRPSSLREFCAALLLLAAVAAVAAAWHDMRWQLFSRHDIGRFAEPKFAPACIEAIACSSPSRLPPPNATALRAIPLGERSRVVVRLAAIRDGTAWRPADGFCQITVDGRLDLGAGDRFRAFGQLSRTAPPRNPGEFDFAEFARADRQLVRMTSSAPASVSVVDRARSWQPRRMLDAVRRGGAGMIERCVGPKRAPLASAILLGEREGLAREEVKSYLVTGTVHLLVVSGMNVAILAAGLHLGMRTGCVGRRTGLAIITVLVAAYAVIAGAQPPVVRAAVLAVVWSIAAWSGRRGLGFNSLAASAIVVLAMNPADLFRVGPQLSFLAVAALIWLNEWKWRPSPSPGDRLDQMIAASRPWPRRLAMSVARWNGWLLFTTLVVWLTSLPLVVSQFHVVTPITILISPAVWLAVLVALWSGFAMLIFGWLAAAGALFGGLCGKALSGLEAVVVWAESLPGGHFWTVGPAGWWTFSFYVGLVIVMVWPQLVPQLRWRVAGLCALVAVGCVPPILRSAARDGLDASFVSVGHGTCVVLEAPTGETMLYDAGSLGSPEAAARTTAAYLWHRGISRIDALVLSHADVDHFNAVPSLLEQFHVGAIYVSPVMFDEIGLSGADEATEEERADRPIPLGAGRSLAARQSGPSELRQAIARAKVPLREIWGGDRLQLGPSVAVDVLHPPRRGVLGNDNANSLTLMVEHEGRRLLLPGDLESPGLEDLMSELPRDCDVLLAPHHGSRRSDPPGFAAWSTPEWVVVSCGDVDVGPALRSYELAGATTFQTNLDGTIHFSLGRHPLSATTWTARQQ